MPTITGLSPQRRNPNRINVFLDGVFAFGVSTTVASGYLLKIGKELSADTVRLLEADIEKDVRYQKVLNYLSYRPRSEREVVDYIKTKHPDTAQEEIDEIVQRLANLHYLDDAAFADWWVRQRREMGKRWGERKIQQELKAKGISAEYISRALMQSRERVDTMELLEGEVAALVRKVQDADSAKRKRKIAQRLLRRGFSWEQFGAILISELNKG